MSRKLGVKTYTYSGDILYFIVCFWMDVSPHPTFNVTPCKSIKRLFIINTCTWSEKVIAGRTALGTLYQEMS